MIGDSNYLPVIGLEVHIELNTRSKMFCRCSAEYHGMAPNTVTCPVCLGLPGTLPVPNHEAIKYTVMLGKACNCEVSAYTSFARKHYFYPDLPKGYQISQFHEPINRKGALAYYRKDLDGKLSMTELGINRIHLEEDTGKLMHRDGFTQIDYNRAGVPLVEIVTEPELTDLDDMKYFLEEIQTVVRYLGISDADMEKGSMRIEPNISMRVAGETALPQYKVELKNINSFRFAKKAVEYEIKRQTQILMSGTTPDQETRGYDESSGTTYTQRSKEDSAGYRYFPEPDIPPIKLTDDLVKGLCVCIPEMPSSRVERYRNGFGLSDSSALYLTRDRTVAEYFEAVLERNKGVIKAQDIANLIVNRKISIELSPEQFISEAGKVLSVPKAEDGKILEVVVSVLDANQQAVDQFRKGKEVALGFIVGQVMKELKGAADIEKVREVVYKQLKN